MDIPILIKNSNSYLKSIIGSGIKDNRVAKDADAGWPLGLDQRKSGELIVADYIFCIIWEIDLNGNSKRIAGTGMPGYSGDGGKAIDAELDGPHDLVIDIEGNILFSDLNNNVYRKIDNESGIITTFAGTGELGRKGDGGLATDSQMDCYCGLAISPDGDIYISSEWANNIRKIDKQSGIISFFAGNSAEHLAKPVEDSKPIIGPYLSLGGYAGDGGPKETATFYHPEHLAFDSKGNLFVCDNSNDRIRKIDFNTGIVSTVLGNGDRASNGDGGLAIKASTLMPDAICLDKYDNLYVGEKYGFRVRKVEKKSGIVTTIAGNGNAGYGSENVLATQTECNSIEVGLVADDKGNVFFSDSSGRVRKIDNTGYVNTVFGGTSVKDGINSSETYIASPFGISIGPDQNIYFADAWNQRIRMVNPSTSIITTVAGSGARAYGGDGGSALKAHLGNPNGVSVNSKGDIYIADTRHSHIRMVDTKGTISNVAGSAFPWDKGDGGPALSANLVHARSIRHDNNDNIYFGDSGIGRIRKIDYKTGIIDTIAGIGITGYDGDGDSARKARVSSPADITFDDIGNLYFVDDRTHVIRKIDANGVITTIAGTGSAGFSPDGTVASKSQIDSPSGLDISKNGILYFSDTGNRLLRRINENGQIETIAGDHSRKATFEDHTNQNGVARIIMPMNIRFYNNNVLLISDHFNHQIHAINVDM